MSIDNGGPAFPCVLHPESREGQGLSGMTLRDYFAAKAMQALATEESGWRSIAKSAYDAADAMLAARGKSHE